MDCDFDLLVIGAGSGGVRASRLAANKGLKVAVVERGMLGGTCVNVGCVPKKLFFYSSTFSYDCKEAQGYGWKTGKLSFSWSNLRDNKTKEIKRLNGVYNNILRKSGVSIIEGCCSFVNKNTVKVNGKKYTAKSVLIATGSTPFIPKYKGSEHVITSDDAFYLKTLPESILVVGGGYIAVEFASIFKGLGVNTTLSYRGDKLLRGFDDDVRIHLSDEIQKKEVKCLFDSQIKEIKKLPSGKLKVTWEDDQVSEYGLVMSATGRIPNTQNLNLDKAGVKTKDNGEILVDDFYCTNIPSIYALGDVIGGFKLTPVAISEAVCFTNHLLYNSKKKMNYSNIATAVFSIPNVATVGLTEEEAKNKIKDIRIYKTYFRHLKHSLTESEEKTFMKLVVDNKTDKVIGCHMVGKDVGEIIQGIAIAINAGATKSMFDETVGIHPTAAEELVTMK